MTWSIRRRIAAWPGAWLTLTKRGVGASARILGVTVNSRGRATISAPSTGVSVSSTTSSRRQGLRRPRTRLVVVLALLVALAAYMLVPLL